MHSSVYVHVDVCVFVGVTHSTETEQHQNEQMMLIEGSNYILGRRGGINEMESSKQ